MLERGNEGLVGLDFLGLFIFVWKKVMFQILPVFSLDVFFLIFRRPSHVSLILEIFCVYISFSAQHHGVMSTNSDPFIETS